MSRILVTGGAGFIGNKLVETLVSNGNSVTIIDHLSNLPSSSLQRYRLERTLKLEKIDFFDVDIVDRNNVESIFRHNSFASVIHLAAKTGVRESINNPNQYASTNIIGTLNLLDLSGKYHVPEFVLASSSSVYAGQIPPFNEDMSTDRPISPYATSKKSAEALAYTYHHIYKLKVAVLRFFTVYGPLGRPDMAIMHFIRNIFSGIPITVYGDGSAERDFTYVDDIVAGIQSTLCLPNPFEIINLGHGNNPVTVSQLIEIIEAAVGKKAIIDLKPMSQGDMPATLADTRKARMLISWRPETAIEQGIFNTVRWYKKNRADIDHFYSL